MNERNGSEQHSCDELLHEIMNLEHVSMLSDLHEQRNLRHLIASFGKIEKGKYSQSAIDEAVVYCFKGKNAESAAKQVKEMLAKK